MKNLTTKQKNKLREARKILALVISGMPTPRDSFTKEPQSINSLLVDAENIISEINEEL